MELEKNELIRYKDACDSLVGNQKAIISIQELLIVSKDNEISKYKDLESSYKGMVDVSGQYNDFLKSENKKLRNKNKVYLIGGGVLTISLTTALLISLFQ